MVTVVGAIRGFDPPSAEIDGLDEWRGGRKDRYLSASGWGEMAKRGFAEE